MGYKYCLICKKYCWFLKDPIKNRYYCQDCGEWYNEKAETIREEV
jgi:transposase-like protein